MFRITRLHRAFCAGLFLLSVGIMAMAEEANRLLVGNTYQDSIVEFANYATYDGGWPEKPYGNTEVGAYSYKPSDSAYGTFDQGGNVFEYTYTSVPVIRGGTFSSAPYAGGLHASYRHSGVSGSYTDIGFRVAFIPEPSSLCLAVIALVGLLAARWRRWRHSVLQLASVVAVFVALGGAGQQAAVAAVGDVPGAPSSRTTAFWTDPIYGNWTDPANWSTNPVYPNNGSPGATDTYHAVIDAAGAFYQVWLTSDVTVDRLTVDSEDASLDFSQGTLEVLDQLDVLAGSISMYGGPPTLRAQRVNVAERAVFGVSDGTLDNITLSGQLKINYQGEAHIKGDLTLENGLIYARDDILFNEGDHTVGGNGDIDYTGGQGSFHARANATVTIGPDVRIIGGGAYISTDSSGLMINQGTIQAVSSAHGTRIAGAVRNENRIEVTDGGSLTIIIDPADWDNAGVIALEDGVLGLAGTFHQGILGTIERTGGRIVLAGYYENDGRTLQLDATTGSWELTGLIAGGTVETTEGTELLVPRASYPFAWSELSDAVVLNGQMRAQGGSQLVVRDGLTVNGRLAVESDNQTDIRFEGTQTLGGSGEVAFIVEEHGGSLYPLRGILTIGPELTIRTDGDCGFLGSPDETDTDGIVNWGTISAETPGTEIVMWGANFGNRGTIRAVEGAVVEITDRALRDVLGDTLVGGSWIVGAGSTIELGSASILTSRGDVTLRGQGSTLAAIDSLRENRGALTLDEGRDFDTDADLDNHGRLVVGDASILHVCGDFRQYGSGDFTLGIGGRTPGEGYGVLSVDGAAELDGVLRVVLTDGFTPVLGDSFDVLDFDSLSLSLALGDLLVLDELPAGLRWDAARFADEGILKVVPEPGSLTLAVFGVAGVLLCVRRRSRRRQQPRAGLAMLLLSLTTLAWLAPLGDVVADEVWWTLPGEGDWLEPSNWDPHVPVSGDSVYIDNGGTARLDNDTGPATSPPGITIGLDGTGTFEQTAGDWSVRGGGLTVGVNAGSSGTYRIGGTADVNFGSMQTLSGDALIEQTGGNLSTYKYYLRTGGVHRQSGGTFNVDEELYVWGSYQLSGTGHLVATNSYGDGISLRNAFRQTGGRLDVSEMLIRDGGEYRMEGGDYLAEFTKVSEGTLLLSGGVFNPGHLYIVPADGFTVSGGTLIISDSIYKDSAPISFQPGAWSVDVQSGIADFVDAGMPNISAASLSSQPDTLTVLPAGTDTSQFASYSPLGMVHVEGSPLHVPAGTNIIGSGGIPDRVIVEGNIEAQLNRSGVDPWINVTGGINVSAGGSAKLGAGTLIVEDSISGMESGVLEAKEFYVGKSGTGRFIQTGGNASGEIYVGYEAGADGYYELSGDASIAAGGGITVGSDAESTGHFRQLGGTVSPAWYVRVSNTGLYEMIDGDLRTDITAVNGLFVQTGGYHENDMEANVPGSPNNSGRFELRGGTHETGRYGVRIGIYNDSEGTYVVSGTGESIGEELLVYSGLFRQEGGTASFSEEVRVMPYAGRTGRIEVASGEFTGRTLAIYGFAPETAVFEQSGGLATLREMVVGAILGGTDPIGGKCVVRGGELIVTETATFGQGHGVLELAGGSATFGEIVLGPDLGYGGSGTFVFANAAATLRVTGSFKLGGSSIVAAVPGSTIRMVGNVFTGSRLENESTNPAALEDLDNVRLVFESGPYVVDQMEIAGRDLGLDIAGLTLNFGLDTLQVGGDDIGQLLLVDAFDNQQDGGLGEEALYVRHLVLGPDSLLDLGGLNLYYLDAMIDQRATIVENGGSLNVVPEPSSLLLAGLGLLGLLGLTWRQRRPRARRSQPKPTTKAKPKKGATRAKQGHRKAKKPSGLDAAARVLDVPQIVVLRIRPGKATRQSNQGN